MMSDDDVPARKSRPADSSGASAKGAAAMKGDDVLKDPAIAKDTAEVNKAGKGAGRTQLDPTAQAHIGKQLKAIYDGVVSQPVPERFLELLKQIDDAPRKPRKDLN